MNKTLKAVLERYFFVTGFGGHVVVILLVVLLFYSEQLTPRQLLKKAADKFDLQLPVFVDEALQPEVEYRQFPMDGVVKTAHPRILLPELAHWNGGSVSPVIAQRIEQHLQQHNRAYLRYCGADSLLPMTVCWLSQPDPKLLKKIVNRMLGFELNKLTSVTTYSNGWRLALAYDLVFPALTESQRQRIEKKIKTALEATLLHLDENSASLWHGRSTHASIAWLCAVVLSGRVENVKSLQSRAQAHFLNAIKGLEYTAIWPGGYNYWVQSRAFLFALAASSYLNGLSGAKDAERVRHTLRQTAYWTLYATRPDNRVEGLGDEGSRVDLKDETRRVIDLIAQMTRDPVLAGYSKYLAKLYGVESYYRGYRWGFLLFNDPSIVAFGDGTIASLGDFLPKARLFGRKSTNLAYFRSGWGKDDVLISFKAGHSFSHHGHYDAGHFSIFHQAPLAINSSTYSGFFTPHRLNYAIRTIAKNSLLIEKPGEQVRPNRFFQQNVADGGQRLTMPTGSAITSIADWFANYQQGRHYEGAELIDFATRSDEYAYISVDLTAAYNSVRYDENGEGGKVSQVIRKFLFLPDEKRVAVFDQVVSTDEHFVKKWLLHTVNQPAINGLKVLKGRYGNGILASTSRTAFVQNKEGRMRVDVLYPQQALMRLVGGKDFQYYVEVDGDDKVLNGINFNQGASDKPWFDVGFWRLEIQPGIAKKQDQFLVVLSLSDAQENMGAVQKLEAVNDKTAGFLSHQSIVVFVPAYGAGNMTIHLLEPKYRLIVVGLSMFKRVTVVQNGVKIGQLSARNGVAMQRFQQGLMGKIQLQW
jgi:hypothetical protein